MKPRFKRVIAALFLSAAMGATSTIPCNAHAQDLPDKPEPNAVSAFAIRQRQQEDGTRERKRAADAPFWIASGAVAGAYIADVSTTAGWIHRCPSCKETGWFDHGGRSLGKIAAGTGVCDAGLLFATYEWKKHIHNRTLNKLWIVAPAFQVGVHVQATIQNQSLGTH